MRCHVTNKAVPVFWEVQEPRTEQSWEQQNVKILNIAVALKRWCGQLFSRLMQVR